MDKKTPAERYRQWMGLRDRFSEDPSIENYVVLRCLIGSGDTEIHRFAGVDPFQALGQALEQAGLDRALVGGAFGGNDHDMDELCLQLLERLIDRKRLEKEGATHLQARGVGISDALVGHLVVAMLEVLQQDSMAPAPSFVVLVREQFGGANTEIYKSHLKGAGRNQALFLAMRMKQRGVQPTIRKIAEVLHVQPSTVSRWFPMGDFFEQVEEFEKSFIKFPRDAQST